MTKSFAKKNHLTNYELIILAIFPKYFIKNFSANIFFLMIITLKTSVNQINTRRVFTKLDHSLLLAKYIYEKHFLLEDLITDTLECVFFLNKYAYASKRFTLFDEKNCEIGHNSLCAFARLKGSAHSCVSFHANSTNYIFLFPEL